MAGSQSLGAKAPSIYGNPKPKKRATYAVVTSNMPDPVFKTGTASRDVVLGPSEMQPTSITTLARMVKDAFDNLVPGYTGEATVFENPQAANWTLSVRVAIEHEHMASASGSFNDSVFATNRVQDVEDEIANIIQKAYDALNSEIHVGWGDYPNVRIWAKNHLSINKSEIVHKPIPGFVFPKWNKAFASAHATHGTKIAAHKFGGLTEDGAVMSATKRKVKVVPGSTKTRNVKVPECPMHKAKMVFDADENIWNCPEDGCEIIFRPKQEERPLGSVVVGKGATSMKVIRTSGGNGALTKILLVSDDNVAIDISNYVTHFQLDNSVPMAPPTIELTIRGMNIVEEKQ